MTIIIEYSMDRNLFILQTFGCDSSCDISIGWSSKKASKYHLILLNSSINKLFKNASCEIIVDAR